MTLDYKNPNDWGKSPLTDCALRLEQFKVENPEEWAAMISADIEALSTPLFESEDYPPFTGTEFLATHETIDDHPYSAAFGQFLGNGIDSDIANTLAFGENRFDLISEDLSDPVRQLATRIYSRFEEMGYWDKLPQSSSNIDYDVIPLLGEKVMDFAIRNPVVGHASHIDEKAQSWGGFESDILGYLSDINKLEQFADYANNAQELSDRLEPFLDNAKGVFEAMEKLTKGQVTWVELRKQYGSHVAGAIGKIRKLNAEFDSEMSKIDAQDRADLLRIDQKRKHALTEVAAQLHQDLQAELWRHENKISSIENKQTVQAERQAITTGLREKRQQLLARARFGSRALEPNQAPQEVIPVTSQNHAPSSSVSATGTVRGWGAMLGNLWQKLGDR